MYLFFFLSHYLIHLYDEIFLCIEGAGFEPASPAPLLKYLSSAQPVWSTIEQSSLRPVGFLTTLSLVDDINVSRGVLRAVEVKSLMKVEKTPSTSPTQGFKWYQWEYKRTQFFCVPRRSICILHNPLKQFYD